MAPAIAFLTPFIKFNICLHDKRRLPASIIHIEVGCFTRPKNSEIPASELQNKPLFLEHQATT